MSDTQVRDVETLALSIHLGLGVATPGCDCVTRSGDSLIAVVKKLDAITRGSDNFL